MPLLQNEQETTYYSLEQATHFNQSEIIIFIHTNVTDHTLFDSICPFFTNQYTILKYDLKGFGKSTMGETHDYSIEMYVEQLLQLVTSLDITRFYLVGIGIGALIALKFARLHEQFVKRLILLSLPCNPPSLIKNIREHRLQIAKGGYHIPIDYILTLTTTILPIDHPEIIKLRNTISQTTPNTYYKIMDLTVRAEPINDLQNVNIPTMILSGDSDLVLPHHFLATAALPLPDVRFVTIPYCSHFIMLDKPQTCAQLILDFIIGDVQNQDELDTFLETVDREMRSLAEALTKEEVKRHCRKKYKNKN